LMKRSKTCRVPSNSRWRRYKQFKHCKKILLQHSREETVSDRYLTWSSDFPRSRYNFEKCSSWFGRSK
jgi:hypothetical protein